ncbi:MAG: efflux RND transporter permease subunit [Prevotella sp.]|nr:efflux RND transporter permease subunit [Prevotella sp.]
MNTKGITEFFVRQPMLFWSAVVAIVIGGVLSFIGMPKLEDPAVAAKQASVVVVYPGATAHEVELKAAQVVEDQLRTLPDVKEIRTECQQGMAQITVEFQMTVMKEDLEQHFDLLHRKVNDAAARLPQECYAPMVIDDMMDVYGLFYALVADEGYTYPEMERYAKLIRRELLAVDGVKRVNVVGDRPEVINIVLTKDKLTRNGIIPTQIMMNLQGAGKTVNAGQYSDSGDRISLHVTGALESEQDISDLLIKTTDGKTVRLGDIAEVRREYQEPQTQGFFVNGKPALAICIALQDGVVVPDVGKAVDACLAEVMQRIPAGMTTEKIFYQPDKVNEAISGFMVNLLESVLIVIVVLMLTMGFRSGLIIGFGLALTIAVSFPILMMMDSTLQRISLGAFIVAMGMLVDNAIVIMDGILIDKQRGLGPKTYLYRIGNHTAMPLLGATIIAIATFLPTYLSPDSTGEYLRDLFLVLCVSLFASWVLALVQVPVCAKLWLPVREKQQAQQGEQYNSKMHQWVRRTITKLLGYKTATLTVAVVLLALCGWGMTKVKNLFFPDFDYSQFVVEYQLPAQASPDRVRHDILEMSAALQKNPKIDRVAATMGNAPAHYSLVRPMTNGGNSYGELIIDCKDFKTVNEVIDELREPLRQQYPDAYIRFRHYNFSITTTHPVEVQFRGPDPAVLRQLSAQAEAIMRRAPHADAYLVENNWKPKGKTLVADYVRQNALRAGVDRANIADALLAATDGLPVGVLHDGDKQVVINMQVRNENGTQIQDLKDIPVWSMNMNMDPKDMEGMMTGATSQDEITNNMFKSGPLSGVTDDISLGWEEQFIYRVNGQRCIEAQCDPNTTLFHGTVAKVESEVRDSINAIALPEGYQRVWAGEGQMSEMATTILMRFMPITVLIILTILLLLFRNWKQVGLVLLCLPFVLCGIAPSLLFLRQPFTFMAIVGLMGLMGMMVKNAIVLIDEINRLYKEEHRTAYDSVVTATVSRVRPVIMASATTILGMLPLLGDPMYGSMAICIMSGLAAGTIITLVLLPIFYSAFFHVSVEK